MGNQSTNQRAKTMTQDIEMKLEDLLFGSKDSGICALFEMELDMLYKGQKVESTTVHYDSQGRSWQD